MTEKRAAVSEDIPPLSKDVDPRLRLKPPKVSTQPPLDPDKAIEDFHANWKKNMAEDDAADAKGKKNFPKGEHLLEDIADDKHLED